MPQPRKEVRRDKDRGIWIAYVYPPEGGRALRRVLCTEHEAWHYPSGHRRSREQVIDWVTRQYERLCREVHLERREVARQRKEDAKPLHLKAAAERWLADSVRPRLRRRVVSHYERAVRYLLAAVGNPELEALDSATLRRHAERLEARPLRPAAVAAHQRAVRTLLNWCHAQGWLSRKLPVPVVRIPLSPPQSYTPGELADLERWLRWRPWLKTHPVSHQSALHLLRAWLLARFALLRADEICHLPVAHLDLDRKLLHVRPVDGWIPKTGHHRSLPLHPDLAEFLAADLARDPRLWVCGGENPAWRDSGGLSLAMRRALREPCPWTLPRLAQPLHSLRDTGITRLLDQGVPLIHVAALAGHSSTSTTERYYTDRAALNLHSKITLL